MSRIANSAFGARHWCPNRLIRDRMILFAQLGTRFGAVQNVVYIAMLGCFLQQSTSTQSRRVLIRKISQINSLKCIRHEQPKILTVYQHCLMTHNCRYTTVDTQLVTRQGASAPASRARDHHNNILPRAFTRTRRRLARQGPEPRRPSHRRTSPPRESTCRPEGVAPSYQTGIRPNRTH